MAPDWYSISEKNLTGMERECPSLRLAFGRRIAASEREECLHIGEQKARRKVNAFWSTDSDRYPTIALQGASSAFTYMADQSSKGSSGDPCSSYIAVTAGFRGYCGQSFLQAAADH